ncbi:hypothetical protein ACH5RR_026641 [Cinchona calisaya]|uniref:Uncharacterized protein n=1 Tax=Cinchona calisaya TaxID=153742 RepID=A0ABD2Z564_9GENT
MINWQLAAHGMENDTFSYLLALIIWSLWLVHCQFLFQDTLPLGSGAIQIMVELLSNLSFISSLKSTLFPGLLAQNLHAPIQKAQAKWPRAVTVKWIREFSRMKLNIDGSSLGNPMQSDGDEIACSNSGKVFFDFAKSFGLEQAFMLKLNLFYMR